MDNKYLDDLERIVDTRKKIMDIHPFLEKLYPVAIVEDDHFLVHDFDTASGMYRFAGRFPTPIPVPQRVKAAFHLECCGNRIACVVSGDVFDESDGIVTIFHEFLHCRQSDVCEEKVKEKLKVAQDAKKANDYMWELNHPFPYGDEEFSELYEAFFRTGDIAEVEEVRKGLKDILQPCDYQYMVWQEWKEGFARYIENSIKRRLGLPENSYGSELPYDRIAFYSGGEHYIGIIASVEPDLVNRIEELFYRMYG